VPDVGTTHGRKHKNTDVRVLRSHREAWLEVSSKGQECCIQHFDFTQLKEALNRYVQGYDSFICLLHHVLYI
jgi:hypothetical protein